MAQEKEVTRAEFEGLLWEALEKIEAGNRARLLQDSISTREAAACGD